MNLGWLLLVLGLGFTELSCCMFDRIYKVVKHEPIPAIYMKKHFGWAHKLGGAESVGNSKAGQTVLSRLLECQIWHQLAGSMTLWGEGLEKGQ